MIPLGEYDDNIQVKVFQGEINSIIPYKMRAAARTFGGHYQRSFRLAAGKLRHEGKELRAPFLDRFKGIDRKTSVCRRSQPCVAHSIAVFSQSLRQVHVLTTCV